ncbi:hypothetical protein K438DRAFT_1948427 [Mycena galopus ATCC 62051]|nr:hypothetical protein K438DRAFT_1948427 [Mycena galopus ATCC 62051]
MVAPPRPSKLSISSTHLLQSAGVELKPHPLQNRFNSGRHWSQTFKASISPQISLATPAVRVAGPLTDHDDEDDISGGSGMLPWTGYVDWRDGEVGLVTIVVSHQDARYIVEMLVSITCAPIFVQYKMIFALLHQCWKIGLMIVSLTSDEILIEGSGKMFSEWDLAQALWDMIIFILKRNLPDTFFTNGGVQQLNYGGNCKSKRRRHRSGNLKRLGIVQFTKTVDFRILARVIDRCLENVLPGSHRRTLEDVSRAAAERVAGFWNAPAGKNDRDSLGVGLIFAAETIAQTRAGICALATPSVHRASQITKISGYSLCA